MQLELTKPELEKFIHDQVQAGRFSTPEAAVEAAIEQMMLSDNDELSDEDVAAIEQGEAELDRGEGRPWGELRAELIAKYPRK
jgi:Arc/MetJ-type ribon-helix-helix transcriptional regulator